MVVRQASLAKLSTFKRVSAAQQVLLDDFNRTTGAQAVGAPQIGPSPTYVRSGNYSCDGTMLVSTTGGEAVISWLLGVTTYSYIATLGVSMTGLDSGLAFRIVSDQQFMYLHLKDGVTDLYKYNSGYGSVLISFGATGWASGDRCRLDVTPTTVAVFKNDVQVGSTGTNSDYGTTGTVGFRSNSSVLKINAIEARVII